MLDGLVGGPARGWPAPARRARQTRRRRDGHHRAGRVRAPRRRASQGARWARFEALVGQASMPVAHEWGRSQLHRAASPYVPARRADGAMGIAGHAESEPHSCAPPRAPGGRRPRRSSGRPRRRWHTNRGSRDCTVDLFSEIYEGAREAAGPILRATRQAPTGAVSRWSSRRSASCPACLPNAPTARWASPGTMGPSPTPARLPGRPTGAGRGARWAGACSRGSF